MERDIGPRNFIRSGATGMVVCTNPGGQGRLLADRAFGTVLVSACAEEESSPSPKLRSVCLRIPTHPAALPERENMARRQPPAVAWEPTGSSRNPSARRGRLQSTHLARKRRAGKPSTGRSGSRHSLRAAGARQIVPVQLSRPWRNPSAPAAEG